MTLEQAIAAVDRFVADTLRDDEAEMRARGFPEHEIAACMREQEDHCRALRDRAIEDMRVWLVQL